MTPVITIKALGKESSKISSRLGRVVYPRSLNAAQSSRGQATLPDPETTKLDAYAVGVFSLNTIRTFSAYLCAIAVAWSLLATDSRAQNPPSPPQTSNKAELHQALLDLTNPWTVMCVAAHPDDEDGTTLTVLRRKHGAHTVSLFTTFGEGGQNAVGPELYEELGVIRTAETIKASEIQGSEPHFLGLKDFGFSKSMEETFRIWGREVALRRMTLKLRELRPDVIITNHDRSRGHGHHQATGQLLLEAFDTAADPKRFPEQLGAVKPWQVQRLFVRVSGSSPADPGAKIVTINPNEIDPVRGTSFAEQALSALQQHATQGPWPKTLEDLLRARRIEGGKLPIIRYRLAREAGSSSQSLPDGATTVFDGLKLSEAVAKLLQPPDLDGRPLTELINEPGRILSSMINWRIANTEAPPVADDSVRVERFQRRADKALATAAGTSLTITADRPSLVPNTPATFTISLSNAGAKPLQVGKLVFNAWGKELALNAPDHLLEDTDTGPTVDVTTPANAPYSVPKAERLYDGRAFGIPFTANAQIDIEGAKFEVSTKLNLDIVPAVEIISVVPSPCVRTEEKLGHCDMLSLSLTNHLRLAFIGRVSITDSFGRRTTRRLIMAPHESRAEKIVVGEIRDRTPLKLLRESGSLKISITVGDSEVPVTEREVPVIYANAQVAADLSVGYVPSFDQTLERALASLGVEAKALAVDQIQSTDLSTYNTIIIDNRGYEAHPGLIAANPRLLQYVNDGGTLIVFYHKDNEWNPDPAKNRPQLAPYPILLGGERVTDENAAVRFLEPRHALLNYPNRISQRDFQNWIQERGLYYPKEWDRQYAALFSTHDPKEPPLRGGLLVARHGKGNYIYTSMVWYRQLRAGVPGAYRMFANMISYGKTQQPRAPRRRAVRSATQRQ